MAARKMSQIVTDIAYIRIIGVGQDEVIGNA